MLRMMMSRKSIVGNLTLYLLSMILSFSGASVSLAAEEEDFSSVLARLEEFNRQTRPKLEINLLRLENGEFMSVKSEGKQVRLNFRFELRNTGEMVAREVAVSRSLSFAHQQTPRQGRFVTEFDNDLSIVPGQTVVGAGTVELVYSNRDAKMNSEAFKSGVQKAQLRISVNYNDGRKDEDMYALNEWDTVAWYDVSPRGFSEVYKEVN